MLSKSIKLCELAGHPLLWRNHDGAHTTAKGVLFTTFPNIIRWFLTQIR